MKLLAAALGLGLALGAMACNGKVDDERSAGYVQLGEATPDAFYGQFVYRKEAPLQHRYPTTTTHGKLGESQSYRADLFMKKDGSYTLRYVELAKTEKTDKATLEPEKEVLVSGTWRVDGSRLSLSGFGEAEGTTSDAVPALKIRFPRDLATAGLAGQEAVLAIAVLPVGLEGGD